MKDALSESQSGVSLDGYDASNAIWTVTFAHDSFRLDEAARKILAANADILKAKDGAKIIIEGHCDESGTNEYNLALGERRAVVVRDYYRMLDIGPSRIRTRESAFRCRKSRTSPEKCEPGPVEGRTAVPDADGDRPPGQR